MTDKTRYALVNVKTGLVENVVVYSDDHLVQIIPDFDAVASPGDSWDGVKFIKAPPAEPEPELPASE